MLKGKYFVYILRVDDNGSTKFYTGMTQNLEDRITDHKLGRKGYTKDKNPKLVYYEYCSSKEWAVKREQFIKKLPQFKKVSLISDFQKLYRLVDLL